MFNFRCSILKECERCDDYCAKKDGKQDRRAYTDRRGCGDPIDIDNLGTMTEGKKFKCEQDCSGWPYSSCKVIKHSNITQPAQSTSGIIFLLIPSPRKWTNSLKLKSISFNHKFQTVTAY